MNFDSLKFPSGRTVKRCKQDAKAIAKNSKNSALPVKHNEALNQVARENGMHLPWNKAIKKLEVDLKNQLQTSAPNCIILSTDEISKFGISQCFEPIYLNYVGDAVPIDELREKIDKREDELKNKLSPEEDYLYKRTRLTPFIGVPIQNIAAFRTTVYYEHNIPYEGIKVYSNRSNRALDLMFKSTGSKYAETLDKLTQHPKIRWVPGHTKDTRW
jgi:hypothetical protein